MSPATAGTPPPASSQSALQSAAGSPAAAPASAPPFHPPPDHAWLARWDEPALEPELPIVDAHHHLFDRPDWRYGPDAYRADLDAGHAVTATVYLQCGEHYLTEGPPALRPVGETQAVERIAARHARGPVRMCAAIVGYADLRRGAGVAEVLEAHLAASPTRFRGIRQGAAADDDPAFVRHGPRPQPPRLDDPRFREGFARLADYGLSFDAWVYHPQLPALLDLARAFPAIPIVLDHVGGPLGIGGYASRREQVFADWRASMQALAGCPNVVVKLGGLAMRQSGFGFHEAPRPPDSQTLADAWRPWIDTCIQAFGPQRCLFESNFPVDQLSCSYTVLWNAFKRLAAGYPAADKAALFSGTAKRVYRV